MKKSELRQIIKEEINKVLNETQSLDAYSSNDMDINYLRQFMENGKYDTNSNQGILIIEPTQDNPKKIAQDALNKWKEINEWLKQFSDGNKWRLRGIATEYADPRAEQIAQELLKLYPSGEIKRWDENNIYFTFPLLDTPKFKLNEKIKTS